KKNIVGNLEGEWTSEWPEDAFNITFSIYDYALNKWTDGNIKRTATTFSEKYFIQWNGYRLMAKKKFFSYRRQIFNELNNELLAQFRWRSIWASSANTKYD